MKGNTLRAAVAGCGGLGRRQVQITHETDGVELVAVCDVNLESAKDVAAKYGEIKTYNDHREMLSENELDCVLVVTPTYTHAEIAVDAANMGIHVFCEKPMAITLEECDAMIEAANANNVKLMIGFVRRFQSHYKEMKRRVDAGDIGDVRLVQSVRQGGRPPAGIGEWRRESKKVGGLHSAYIHEMDQMLWLAGDAKTVRGVVNYGTFDDTDVEDSIWMCIEFQNGAIGAIGSSQVYPLGWYEMGVGGTKGAMRIASGANAVVMKMHDGNSETIEVKPNDALADELHHFFDSVRNDTEPCVTGIDGRKALEVVMAAFRSSETERVVQLPLSHPYG